MGGRTVAGGNDLINDWVRSSIGMAGVVGIARVAGTGGAVDTDTVGNVGRGKTGCGLVVGSSCLC